MLANLGRRIDDETQFDQQFYSPQLAFILWRKASKYLHLHLFRSGSIHIRGVVKCNSKTEDGKKSISGVEFNAQELEKMDLGKFLIKEIRKNINADSD